MRDFVRKHIEKPWKLQHRLKKFRGKHSKLVRLVCKLSVLIEKRVRDYSARTRVRTSIKPLTMITFALECINAIFQSELASVVILQRRSRLALHRIHKNLLKLPPPNRRRSGRKCKKFIVWKGELMVFAIWHSLISILTLSAKVVPFHESLICIQKIYPI
ncbi:hypothetical protein AHF37_06190 [Paragonimus kellicotti]|nr:hypothetical protein AHF37_06190 [Paragonimus kellicotti]